MTQHEEGGMGQPAASDALASEPAADSSAWAPLRQRAFAGCGSVC
jgi:hypothetical protein